MDEAPIRNYDDNKEAPWYREYLLMSPALIIVILIFTIFIKLLCFRRFLTREIRALAEIEVPPPPPKKNRCTQTGLDKVQVVYDGPSTSKIGQDDVIEIVSEDKKTSDLKNGTVDMIPAMSSPAMIGDFAL